MIGSSDAEAILNGLSVAVLVVDPDEAIIFANPAAEQFFQLSISS
ncbi:MAG: PAS domain-containing protein, partial [Pseudomonadota bacterium]|nr:PAS domain-containing protein [Pseudomonadota bacterium]